MSAVPEKKRRSHWLTTANVVLSSLLSFAFFAWYFALGSSLALAQASDSLLDVLTALILAWAVRLAAEPGDERHPFGHRSAEPLAAMWVAAMAALLSYRVAADAVMALWTGTQLPFRGALVASFVVKAVVRGGLVLAIDRSPKESRGPALLAMRVDARNDVLLSTGSAVASLASGVLPWLDPVVALPMAAWIGWSGYELGRDNARLLMGEAPSLQRLEHLRKIALEVPGVRGVHDVRAQASGNHFLVHLHIVVDPDLRVAAAHDLGEKVRSVVEAEPDIDHCDIHIDPPEGVELRML